MVAGGFLEKGRLVSSEAHQESLRKLLLRRPRLPPRRRQVLPQVRALPQARTTGALRLRVRVNKVDMEEVLKYLFKLLLNYLNKLCHRLRMLLLVTHLPLILNKLDVLVDKATLLLLTLEVLLFHLTLPLLKLEVLVMLMIPLRKVNVMEVHLTLLLQIKLTDPTQALR